MRIESVVINASPFITLAHAGVLLRLMDRIFRAVARFFVVPTRHIPINIPINIPITAYSVVSH